MALFSTGPLPPRGNTIEFARIKDNTLQVDVQANEGDTLKTGTVTTEDATATIKTYGGGATLSKQVIERSYANVLDLHLRGLSLVAGQKLAADFATFFEATVNAQAAKTITAGQALDKLSWKSLLAFLLDAQDAYEDLGLSIDGLVLKRAAFEAIAGKTDTTGRPLFAIEGTAVNAIGTLNASGRYAALDGLKIVTSKRLTANGMGENVQGAFYTGDALRTYRSPLASLQEGAALELSDAFSIYFYAAFADEIPSGIVPVKFGE